MDSKFKHIAEDIRRDIEALLNRVGLLCRVFARGKDEHSIQLKLDRSSGKYSIGGRLIQDAIGVRVALYFQEDIEIVQRVISARYALDHLSSTVDTPATDQFSVSRHNLIFKIPENFRRQFDLHSGSRPIDATFEIQLRSILSEGWHEVDHDLRYKCKDHWNGQDDLSRALNGIMATIETAEWSMHRIFDELAYRHYKKKDWSAMLHSKIRMRVQPILSKNIVSLLDSDFDFAKEIYRVDRNGVIEMFSKVQNSLPVSLDNVFYIWNLIGPRNPSALAQTPVLIAELVNAES